MKPLFLFLSLLVTSTLCAAPPKAVISGPSQATQGDLVILSSEASTEVEHFLWKIETDARKPAPKADEDLGKVLNILHEAGYEVTAPKADEPRTYVELEDGSKIIIASHPGIYTIHLVVGNAEGVDLATYTLEITAECPDPVDPAPGPSPDPEPPEPPLPQDYGLSTPVSEAVKAVASADNRNQLQQLAFIYETLGSQNHDSVQTLISLTAQETSKVLDASSAQSWSSVMRNTVGPLLTNLRLQSVNQHRSAWLQIASGIRLGLISPDPIIPPDPEPQPPVVDGAPFPANGLHVLVIEETSNRTKLPVSQLTVLASVEQWVSGGKWRVLDKDVEIRDDPVWSRAMQVGLESGTPLPVIAISNGRTGYVGPLPKTIPEARALLSKYK